MNEPTEVVMPAPSTTALTGDIKGTLEYVKPIKKFLFFACGTSVTESVFGRITELESKVLSEYKTRAEGFVFDSPEHTDRFGPLPQGFLPEVAKDELKKEDNGAKIYKAFKGMKSQFRTVWTKYIVIKSGENKKDMIDRVCREVWAERHNNELRKKGKEPVALALHCPASFVPLERATFAVYWDHPILKRAKSPLTDDGGTDLGKVSHEGVSVMSRAEQRALKRKAATKTNNGIDNERDALMVQMKKQHMAIATRQAVAIERQNDIIVAMIMKDLNPALFEQMMSNITTTTTTNNNNNNNSSSSSDSSPNDDSN